MGSGRQVALGHRPHTHLETLQPQPQAEIKATGISLVGLPRAKAPQDPAAPTPSDSKHFQALPWVGPSGRLKPEVQSYGQAHCSSGTWGESCPFYPLEPGPGAGDARPALEGVLHEPSQYSLGDSRPGPQANSQARSPNTTPSPGGLRSLISPHLENGPSTVCPECFSGPEKVVKQVLEKF